MTVMVTVMVCWCSGEWCVLMITPDFVTQNED